MKRYADERVCIIEGPTWAVVGGVHVDADGVEALLADIRRRVPPEKDAVWWIGPSARPRDLYERLQALSLGEPRDRTSLLHALALTREPAAPGDVEVDRIKAFEQFAAARELQWDAFDTPEDRRAKNRARLREDFEESQRVGVPVGFLATLDGKPAGTALAIPSERGVFLIGGSTAEWARGRGVYRALVHARWEYAVGRGTPALVTHAMPNTSYPILRRLGFDEVCTIRRLEDLAPR
ncbi:MAG: GNAT family N-acetyltransferase [Gaiellaceae bacterium]